MTLTSTSHGHTHFSRLKLFLALSRTSHGILDMATPAFAALLWLGGFPPLHVTLLGVITTFAGYTAVYALNDVVDFRIDREKIHQTGLSGHAGDLDALWVRHPLAQGMLSLRDGILWAAGWSAVALIGAALLNPVCVVIFLLGCLLETFYCLLLKISHHRVIISGGVKTSGAVAAVFAVDPSPGIGYIACLFLLFFFWEIGGQNVPNDWTDMEADRAMNARTVPVRFGSEFSLKIILVALACTVILTPVLFLFSQSRIAPPYLILVIITAGYFLILPALRLRRTKKPRDAMALFNKASYFPAALLCIVLITITI